MTTSICYDVGEYSFVMTFNGGSMNGVTVNPYDAQFDNPEWIEAFAFAVEHYHALALWYVLYENACDPMAALDGHLPYSEQAVTQGRTFLEIYELLESALKPSGDMPQNDKVDFVLSLLRDPHKAAAYRQQIRAQRSSDVPKHKRREKGFVYLLPDETGTYKIGCTADPESRAKSYRTHRSTPVEFTCLIASPDMKDLEKQLHIQFADKRVNGEWFALDSADVEYIKSLAVQHGS